MRNNFRFLWAAAFFLPAVCAAAERISVLTIEGMINPVIGNYVEEELEKASKAGASAVLIELNTPGGLLDATRDVIKSMVNSELPVIVHVAPRGARATSAGVFITMAADVAAMSPETHIGAAHPVNVDGKTIEPTMNEKMVSDAAAYIRTIASEKGRNADWAERAVRTSVSVTAEEALKEKVIDVIAASRADLLKAIDGRVVKKNGKGLKLKTLGAALEERPMSRFRKWLQMLGHPNIAYILMTIGVYGLIYELASPGIGLGGAVGVICLLLAFFSLQVLPINIVGLALIGLGVLLLALELFNPTHGLLTFGGLISFALGSFFLIDVSQSPAVGRISIELIASTVGVTGLFFGIAIKKTFDARRARPKTGAESLLGMKGDITESGHVSLNGELWAVSTNDPVANGDKVIVTGLDGNTLLVKKI